MDKDLGEFVGKGFALLRDRIKAVEARVIPVAINGKDAVVDYDKIKALIPDPIPGEPGRDAVVDYARIEEAIPAPIPGEPGKDAIVDYAKIKAMIPKPIPGEDAVVDYSRIEEMIPDPISGKDAVVDYARIRDMIPPPIPGPHGRSVKGEPGNGIRDVEIDKRGHLIITLDDGREIDAGKVKGKDAVQFQGMIAGGPSGGSPAALKWIDYATGFSADPTLTQTIATGDVYTYTYSNGTLYRLVPSGSEQDAFYSTFTGGVLGGLVAQKGITI